MLDIMEILMGHSTLPICLTWFDVAGPHCSTIPSLCSVVRIPRSTIGSSTLEHAELVHTWGWVKTLAPSEHQNSW